MELEDDIAPVNVGNIPFSFPDLVGTDKYILLGIIRYIGSFPNKNPIENKENVSVGHYYTAICRRHTAWYEFNDLTADKRKLSQKELTMFVGLLIYAKVPQ